jgi:hypothetical protein
VDHVLALQVLVPVNQQHTQSTRTVHALHIYAGCRLSCTAATSQGRQTPKLYQPWQVEVCSCRKSPDHKTTNATSCAHSPLQLKPGSGGIAAACRLTVCRQGALPLLYPPAWSQGEWWPPQSHHCRPQGGTRSWSAHQTQQAAGCTRTGTDNTVGMVRLPASSNGALQHGVCGRSERTLVRTGLGRGCCTRTLPAMHPAYMYLSSCLLLWHLFCNLGSIICPNQHPPGRIPAR